MYVTAEPDWTADFAAQVLARRANVRYVPYSEFATLDEARLITGWKLPKILSELNVLTLWDQYAVVHPDSLVPFQKKKMVEALKAAIAEQDEILRGLQSVQQSLEVKQAA